MAFIYEEVGEENRELWESIGWKNWSGNPLGFYSERQWSIDKERNIYLVRVGGYIDMPIFWDMSYEGRIIRMEVAGKAKGNNSTGVVFNWKIMKINIPKSLWGKKQDIVEQITNAVSVVRCLTPLEKVIAINVEMRCEPECVEVDYNGR
ncbi:MAG: hypothetical protein K1W00_11815 [Lachnospiraceae bacterium]